MDVSVAEFIEMMRPEQERFRKMADIFGVEEAWRENMFQDLSGGERQKIAMARAILKGGSVYLLDEPEKNLDVESIEWLKGFMRQTEKTMVYVTHDERLV